MSKAYGFGDKIEPIIKQINTLRIIYKEKEVIGKIFRLSASKDIVNKYVGM
jgi:hypothetical protein